MKVTFICPVYNKEKYLPFVIQGIKNQTGTFDKEYIFINDGSSDNSLDVIKKLTKKLPQTTILTHTNKGPAFSTQLGIEMAEGDYIKLVGGDDYLLPNCTSLLLNNLKKTNTVAIFSRYILDDYLKKNLKLFEKKEKTKNLKKISFPLHSTLLNCFSGTSPTLYCNRSIKKTRGCNKKLFVEDFSLALELSIVGDFSFIENITSVGPLGDKNRIMVGNEAQLLHDYNAAIYFFLKKHLINKNIMRKVTQKCIGRTEKFARRTLNYSFFNELNLLRYKMYLKNYLQDEYLLMIKRSCEFFYNTREKQKIRYRI